MDVSQVGVGKTDVSEMDRTSNARDLGLSEILEYFEQVLRISEIEELVEREKMCIRDRDTCLPQNYVNCIGKVKVCGCRRFRESVLYGQCLFCSSCLLYTSM